MRNFYEGMSAFYNVDDLLIKAYDMGDDWKMLTNKGDERWFSKWTDNEYGSLKRAFIAMLDCFDESKLVLCERG